MLIHGIGSQRPLATIKGFVDALVNRSERWSKPDELSSSYELRRYQLVRTRARPRTDLFELYWADKLPGTKLSHTMSWLRAILLRRPRNVGARLRPIAYLTRLILASTAVGLVALVLTFGVDGVSGLWHDASAFAQLAWVSFALSAIAGVVNGVLVRSLGDAARYLDAAPDNIAVRQSIRQSGVALLTRLHAEGRYDRIVVVGHSLGSVIGYDILRHYWCQVHRSHESPMDVDQRCLHAYQQHLAAERTEGWAERHRELQRDLWREYRRLGLPWLVTDLVTLGSPLTHADTLLARSPDDLAALVGELELPSCPPHRGSADLTRAERYLVEGSQRTVRMLNHAAPFAITRWTNVYVPTTAIVFGDPIGGPVAPMLGDGIRDVPVSASTWIRAHSPLAHTSYWLRAGPNGGTRAIEVLVKAIDLDSRGWLDPHVAEMPWESSVRD